MSDPRRYESGPGFVRAKECPDCFHTRCGEDCVCNCDAAHAEYEAAWLRGELERAKSEAFAAGIEAAVPIIRRYLQFDSQRAVSWHEVQDCIDAICALFPERPPAEPSGARPSGDSKTVGLAEMRAEGGPKLRAFVDGARPSEDEPCQACGDSGEQSDGVACRECAARPSEAVCARCGGTRLDPEHRGLCGDCGGTGKAAR